MDQKWKLLMSYGILEEKMIWGHQFSEKKKKIKGQLKVKYRFKGQIINSAFFK